MADFTTRLPNEAKTHELFAQIQDPAVWSSERIMIATVFKAMYWASLPMDQIERVAAAMHNYEKLDLAADLTFLCRKKILRSRMSQGKRLYEVNY